jgi:hypothetical protein
MCTTGVGRNAAVAALACACAAAWPGAAVALEPGVHVDPRSPAAKEYALPLNQARQTGEAGRNATGSSGSGSSSGEAALFGAGIKPPRGGSGPRGNGTTAVHAAPGSGSAPAQLAAATDPAISRALHESGGGDGSTLALIGGGVAVLVLGGFGGTVLRHSRRPST